MFVQWTQRCNCSWPDRITCCQMLYFAFLREAMIYYSRYSDSEDCYILVVLLWLPYGIIILYFCPVVSFFLLFLFLAKSQWPQIGCLPYFYTWCSPSANLECSSLEMQDPKNHQKFAICTPSHNFVRLCLHN